MKERAVGAGSQLSKARQSLERWRRSYGGRGRPIPAEFWAEAVALAGVEGVDVTSRALRLDRARLASRMEHAADPVDDNAAPRGFVEIDAGGLCATGHAVVRMVGRDGERMEIALSATGAVDIVALARAFWTRPR
jgi:hypothetical protein